MRQFKFSSVNTAAPSGSKLRWSDYAISFVSHLSDRSHAAAKQPVPTATPMSIASALTAALPALTANLALEIAPVRANLIAAGFVDTPLSAELLGDQLEKRRNQLRTTLPIGRVVGPADVAA